ncbi:hypothetical protein SCLCIDRAFT_25860 [Scleroderma citrinum Foug A]|uniref:DUF6532 domain-containing protein n=1 Tax=Scleroderma citrinum Foug A TaxID=1036808 RepID=A0A0C3DYR9_9AGAM|nr:hypothetical protein SCLCIDRAFT_25860 [Scleroderma citrinum Foug A]
MLSYYLFACKGTTKNISPIQSHKAALSKDKVTKEDTDEASEPKEEEEDQLEDDMVDQLEDELEADNEADAGDEGNHHPDDKSGDDGDDSEYINSQRKEQGHSGDLDDEIIVDKSPVGNKGKMAVKAVLGDKMMADPNDEIKGSSHHSRGSKLGKTSLSSFKNPDIHRLAKLGHHRLCQHVATIKAFPFPVDKDELCWSLIQEGAAKDTVLEDVLAEVERELSVKEQLLDYVWGAATQVRGELIAKARMAVPTAYGLQGDSIKGNRLFDVLKWLIQQGKLIHSRINTKAMTCDESKPWKNLIFAQLIKSQWWGLKGEGRHLGPDPTVNPFLNAPVSTLALVATVVKCVLTGLFSRGTIDFNENIYQGRWDHYMKMLGAFKAQSPTYLQTVQQGIQQSIGVHPVEKAPQPTFDFSLLEEASKMELEGAE